MATQFDAQFPDAAEAIERLESYTEAEAIGCKVRFIAEGFGVFVRVVNDAIEVMESWGRTIGEWHKLMTPFLGRGPVSHRGRPNRRWRKAAKMALRAAKAKS